MLFFSLFSSIVSFIVKQRNQSQRLLAYIFEKNSCKAAYFVKRTDFKYENIIFKFHPKNYPSKAFLVPNLRIFLFCTKLCNNTNFKTLTSNVTRIFSNSSSKIPKSGTFGPQIKDFYICTKTCNKTNLMTQISNTTIAFSNSSSKIGYENQAFLVPYLGILVFSRNFAIRLIRGADFKYDNSFLKFQPKHTYIKHFRS